MKARILLFAAALAAGWALSWVGPSPAAAPPPKADPDADVQDVVVLGDAGPVLLRLRVRVDGQPLRAAWQQAVDKLFDYLDRDKDGALDKKEAAGVPAPVRSLSGWYEVKSSLLAAGGAPSLATLDADKDGKVSRRELADYYRRVAPPLEVRHGGRGGDGWVKSIDAARLWMAGPREALAGALNQRLFALLDADKDGELSKAELAAAPKVLGKLDADDDEVLTTDEVLGRSNPNASASDELVVSFDSDGKMSGGASPDGLFYLVNSDRPDKALAQRLLGRYGAKALTLKASGLAKAAFAALDGDGDGALDAEELARFALRPPDLELAVRLDAKGAAVEAVKKSAAVKAVKGGVELALGNTRVTLAGPPDASGTRWHTGDGRVLATTVADAPAQYKAQFKAADKDGNGYLDEKEAERSPSFRGLFKRIDADGDGKLFEKEVLAYFDAMDGLQRGAVGGTASLRVTEQGQGLFDLADLDKDGRLSVRELRRLPELIAALDLDGDRALSRRELPRDYRASFRRGSASEDLVGYAFFLDASGATPSVPLPARTEGPLWFRKMDRNRDNDVSRREFLGTDEQFKKIDADKDGLISPKEAADHDRKLREAKKG